MGSKYVYDRSIYKVQYCKIMAIPNKEAETVADTVFTKRICCYGCPLIIHTNGGKEFINNLDWPQNFILNWI
jgi:hypothetical protein